MMRPAPALAALFLSLSAAAHAGTLVAARNIAARSVLDRGDVTMTETQTPGALSAPEDVIGKEARVTLYAGRPLRPGDVGPPAVIERNQTVTLRYRRGALAITAEARALGRAGVGETVRAMNLSSRSTISGRVLEDGTILVAPGGAAGAGER